MSFLKHVRTLVVPGVNTNVLRGWAKGRFLKGWRRFMRNPSSDNAQVLLRLWGDDCVCCSGLRAHVTWAVHSVSPLLEHILPEGSDVSVSSISHSTCN